MSGIRGIAQVAVHVQDVERAKRFYRDVVGLTHLFDAPPSLCFFDCGGIRLMMSTTEGTEARASSIIYFDVADITAVHARMAAADVRFTEPPRMIASLADRDVWLAAFDDGEGNTMALMSHVARTVTA